MNTAAYKPGIFEFQINIPYSHMEWPKDVVNKCKFIIWSVYTPFHPYVRDISTALGIVRHAGRQKFLFGLLRSDREFTSFVTYLVHKGYCNHFVAWKDDGEILSLRKTVGFTHQYHVRVFNDGEVRAHYELTPEYRPIAHLREVGMEEQKEFFTALFEGWLR